MTLQALYGTIPQIFGKGECARVRSTHLVVRGVPSTLEHPRRGQEWDAVYKQAPSVLFIWELAYFLKWIHNPKSPCVFCGLAQSSKEFEVLGVPVGSQS